MQAKTPEERRALGAENAILAVWYGAIYVTLFLLSPQIRPAKSALVILALISAATCWAFLRNRDAAWRKGYQTWRMRALIGAVCAYASFASFGYRLFLAGNEMMFGWDRLLNLALGALWFYPLATLALGALERCGARCAAAELPAQGPPAWRVGVIAGVIAMACLSVPYAAFFPGSYMFDPVNQLREIATGSYSNWHPVVHTLILKLLLTIWNHPGFIVFVQLALFAAVIGRVAAFARSAGARPRWIYLAAAVFALLPNQAVTNISPSKDFMFTYALVWGTILLFELALDLSKANRPGWLVQMLVCMYLVKELRHNGILPFIFMAALVIIVSVKYWARLQPLAILCVGLVILLIGVTEGPVYSALQVTRNALSPYTTMFCAVGSVLHKGEELSPEAMTRLEEIMPFSEWLQYYSRFSGPDNYMYRQGMQPQPADLSGITAKEAFSIYFEALAKRPDVVIKDRLDGMNLLWDVSQPDDPESYNGKAFLYYIVDGALGLKAEGVEDGTYYTPQNPVANAYRSLVYFALPGEEERDQVTDMLLWRSGVYLIFLLLLAVYWAKNGLRRMWWAAMPLLGNVLALALAMFSQYFRYVYFIQVLAVTLTVLTFVMQRGRATRETGEA